MMASIFFFALSPFLSFKKSLLISIKPKLGADSGVSGNIDGGTRKGEVVVVVVVVLNDDCDANLSQW